MSKRKRKQDRVKELENLKTRAFELKTEVSKQRRENFKQFNIRNLKIFGHACNFAMPFVISTGILVGGFCLFNGGLPFRTDKITKYKTYNLELETKSYIKIDEDYEKETWLSDPLPDNTLTVWTPWQENEGQYVRLKREYNIKNSTNLDLYNAVLDEDYQYISDNLNKFKEEKQIINEIDLETENDYFFEASLHFRNKEDILKHDESDLKNIIITIIESVLGIGVGAFFAFFRDFEFLMEVKETNNKYKINVNLIKSLKKELKETNKKIMSLTKKGGC